MVRLQDKELPSYAGSDMRMGANLRRTAANHRSIAVSDFRGPENIIRAAGLYHINQSQCNAK